jgi:hypothetical protein
LRILTGVIRLYQQQAEKINRKRTWAGISNVCTDIKFLHAHADLVLSAEEPKTRSEGRLGKFRDPREDWASFRDPMSNLYIYIRLKSAVTPTEVKCDFLKSSFFVVAVFIWPNRVVIGIHIHRPEPPPPHGPFGVEPRSEKYFVIP